MDYESLNSLFVSNNLLFNYINGIFINLFNIYLIDYSIQYLFTAKGRWYKIHFVLNTITVLNLYDKIIYMITDPSNNYINYEKDNYNLSLRLMNSHLSLHIYHLLFFNNLNFWDYFHHIVFAFFGIIPGMLFTNSNQLYFQLISGGGITGMIEYGSLSLMKHDMITKYNQKRLNMIIYIFVRLPLCVTGCVCNIIAYSNNLINDQLWITVYLNLLLYLNGTLFTYLTCKSYADYKKVHV